MARMLVLVMVAAAAALAATARAQNATSTRCCSVSENLPVLLACGDASDSVIASVEVAEYGTPAGYCTTYARGSCTGGDVALGRIRAACVGQRTCAFTVNEEWVGPDPCPGTGKSLVLQWTCAAGAAPSTIALPAPTPLRTSGRYIVDATGQRVKLAAVNWYGGQCQDFVPNGLHVNHVDDIARLLRPAGFNTVRLQWSNELVQTNPIAPIEFVAANPQFYGLRALDVYTAVVESLGRAGVYVILDNHMSDADWCCNPTDENGLWFNRRYSEETFFRHWELMVERHRNYSNVIGAELRNELRGSCGSDDADGNPVCRLPNWNREEATSWYRASTVAGNRILAVNPDALVFISGLASSSRLGFVRTSPITLAVPQRLVYVSHDYPWWHPDAYGYPRYEEAVESHWGFIVADGANNYTAPLFVSEFGTCHSSLDCIQEGPPSDDARVGMNGGRWFSYVTRYLRARDLDFAYWALNGSTCKGNGRVSGGEEGYGLLNMCWNAYVFPPLLEALQALQAPSPTA